jgi:1-acyl-sn-glycerol-3-phosphate acyltransferase
MGTVLVFAIALVVCLFYELPAYLARFFPLRGRLRLVGWVAAKSLAHFVASAKAYMGIRLAYERDAALELPERFIVVANHQSLLDIPLLLHYFSGRRSLLFVAKKELGMGIPLISSVLRIQGHALVDRRGHPAASMRSLSHFARYAARNGFCPAVFPEGTRSKDGSLGKFHSAGLRRIAEYAPQPLLVVALDGGHTIATLTKLFRSGFRTRYRVKALALLEPAQDKKDSLERLEHARSLIGAQLDAWRAEDEANKKRVAS